MYFHIKTGRNAEQKRWNKHVWSRKQHVISIYTLWRDKQRYVSFIPVMWVAVCLFVWLLKRNDKAEFIHSLLPYNNATYILKYCQYNKQSAEQWLQPERKEVGLLFRLQEAELKGTLSRSRKSLAEAEMWWMHLILVQMEYKFGWKSPWCTKSVCRKHEGIPLHYKNIIKHEKARTGVIVHLSSLRRGEQYCYINLVKKVSGLPEKLSEILRSLTITIPTNYYVTIHYQPDAFSIWDNVDLGLKKKRKEKNPHISKISKVI